MPQIFSTLDSSGISVVNQAQGKRLRLVDRVGGNNQSKMNSVVKNILIKAQRGNAAETERLDEEARSRN